MAAAAAAVMTGTGAFARPLVLLHDTSAALTALAAVTITALLVVSIQRRAIVAHQPATSSPPPSFASSFSADEEEEEEDDDDLYTSDEGVEDEQDLPAVSAISAALDSTALPKTSSPRSRHNLARRRPVGSGVAPLSSPHSPANSTLVLITSKDPTSNLCFRPAQVLLQAQPTTHPHAHHPRVASRLASRVSSSPSRSPTISPKSSPRLTHSTPWEGTATPPAAPERNSSYHKAYDEQQRNERRASQPAIPSILRKQGQKWQPNDGNDSEPDALLSSPSPSSSLPPSPPIHLRSCSQPSPARSIHLTEPDWDQYVSFHIRAQERQAKRRQLVRDTASSLPAPLESSVAQDWLHYTSFLDASDNDGPEPTSMSTPTPIEDFWYERFTPSTAAAGRNWDWRKRRATQRRLALLQDARAVEEATAGEGFGTVAASDDVKGGDGGREHNIQSRDVERSISGDNSGGQAGLPNRQSNVKLAAPRQQGKKTMTTLRPRPSLPSPSRPSPPQPAPAPPRRASSTNSIHVTPAPPTTKKPPPTDYGSLRKHNAGGDVSFFPSPAKKGVFV